MQRLLLLVLVFSNALVFAEPLPQLTAEQIQEKVKLFDYKPYAIEQREDTSVEVKMPIQCFRGVYEIMLPVYDSVSQKTVYFPFTLKTPSEFLEKQIPLVFLVPTIRGPTVLESQMAQRLCEKGIASVLVDVMPTEFDLSKDGMNIANQQLILGVKAMRTFLDYISGQPLQMPDFLHNNAEKLVRQIDVNNIGVMGASNGATLGTLFAAVDSRIKATAIMGALANIPYVLSTSQDRVVVEFREAMLNWFSFPTMYDFEMALRKAMPVSPVDLASLIKTDSIYQIIIDDDNKVATETQDELLTALGAPSFLRVPGGHTAAIIDVYLLNSDLMTDFIIEKLQ